MFDNHHEDDPRLLAERRALRAQGKVLPGEPMFDQAIEYNPMPFGISVRPVHPLHHVHRVNPVDDVHSSHPLATR